MYPHFVAGIELKERAGADIGVRSVKASEKAATSARILEDFFIISANASGLRR
jgi:hypothetical protein